MPDLAVQEIPLEKLHLHQANPRVDVGDISELTASVKESGVLEPILVVQNNGGFDVVAGSRRLAAAKAAGLRTIPAIAREMSDNEAAIVALVENLQRKDLAPLEEARGYQRWLELTGKSQKELAAAVGKDPSTISNAVRLLAAAAPIQKALEKSEITAAHARVALELHDPSLATSLKLQSGITVDELHDQVTRVNAEYDTKGEGARAVLRAALAAAKAKYPNATITWKAGQYDVVSLISTLGQPPAKIAGSFGAYLGVTTAGHDKACTCRAYQLDARRSYTRAGDKISTTLERVCIDPKGYAAAKPKPKKLNLGSRRNKKTSPSKPPKQLTPQQVAAREAKERKKAIAQIARAFTPAKPRTKAGPPVFKKLRAAQIPADAARAIVWMEEIEYGGNGLEGAELLAWERLVAMPAKKVAELASALLARRIEDSVVGQRQFYGPTKDDSEAAARAVAQHFGVKVAEPKAKKSKR